MKIPSIIEAKKHRKRTKGNQRAVERLLDKIGFINESNINMHVELPAKSIKRKGLQREYLVRRLKAIKRNKEKAEREMLEHTSLGDLIK